MLFSNLGSNDSESLKTPKKKQNQNQNSEKKNRIFWQNKLLHKIKIKQVPNSIHR